MIDFCTSTVPIHRALNLSFSSMSDYKKNSRGVKVYWTKYSIIIRTSRRTFMNISVHSLFNLQYGNWTLDPKKVIVIFLVVFVLTRLTFFSKLWHHTREFFQLSNVDTNHMYVRMCRYRSKKLLSHYFWNSVRWFLLFLVRYRSLPV